MRNILGFFFLFLVFFGCNKSHQSETKTGLSLTENEDGFVITLDPLIYPSLFDEKYLPLNDTLNSEEYTESNENKKLEEITDLAKKKIEKYFLDSIGVNVNTSDIYIGLESWVFLDSSITKVQLDKLEADSVNVKSVEKNAVIEARKAMMQGKAFVARRKPMMQEQLRYNDVLHHSNMIKYSGGGEPVAGPLPSRRFVWIVDTGIDRSHPDLNFTQGGINRSISTLKKDPDPFTDPHGHGTYVAGIIAAKSRLIHNRRDTSEISLNGMYPGANIVSVKSFNKQGSGRLRNVKAAIDHIAKNAKKRDVVNLSFGLDSIQSCKWGNLDKSIMKLANAEVFVVMSAGNNESFANTNFPGCLNSSYLITVGSMDNPYSNVIWFSFFSNYGLDVVDWVAPGEYILTTSPDSKYTIVSGTSFSTAIVSGIIYGNGNFPDTLGKIERSPGEEYPNAFWRKNP